MSFVTAQPEFLAAAAADLQPIGVALGQAFAGAAPTTAVMPPAADPVSAMLAARFVAHGGLCQAMGAQGLAIHESAVSTLGSGAGSYATAEAANAVLAS
ncbi:MAG: PE family protein [Mycobacterium sp.]